MYADHEVAAVGRFRRATRQLASRVDANDARYAEFCRLWLRLRDGCVEFDRVGDDLDDQEAERCFVELQSTGEAAERARRLALVDLRPLYEETTDVLARLVIDTDPEAVGRPRSPDLEAAIDSATVVLGQVTADLEWIETLEPRFWLRDSPAE